MNIFVVLILAMEALFALFLLYRDGLLNRPLYFIISVLLLLLAFSLRGSVFGYETLDYQNFLTKWVDFFRENGGFAALSRPVGNYNIPYLYFLALFSYFDVKDLYLIKALSVFFDVILAWAAMGLVSRFTQAPGRLLGCFFAVLFLPSVFLNSSVWAQCDSIYAALALLGIYLALKDRPCLSMICAAMAFGFKLQAVFILPVYAVLWMYGRFSWKHFFIFPLSYVLLVLPAVLLGRPFLETLTLYFSQTGSIGSALNYNSSSIFAFFYHLPDEALAAKLGIAVAFAFMLAVLALCFIKRRWLTDRAVLAAALLLAVGIPFLLPHMHERYFYAADILSLVLAFAFPPYAAAALLVQFASLLGYHAYLKMRFLLPMSRGAEALVLVLAMAVVCLMRSFRGKNFRSNKNTA